MSTRIIAGISGGVDSAVAALRLQQAGYEVEGLFMFNWADDDMGRCQAAADFNSAREVCTVLGIPLHQADFSAIYREQVFQPFLDGYAAGRTPNPDVLCNRAVKFDALLSHARRLGAARIATGHYARIEATPAGPRLLRGVDPGKDQSYFLAAVPATALRQVLFPLGELRKKDVRALARAHGLPNHARADSTGVCFIGERDFAGFLGHYLHTEPGPIRAADGPREGAVIGRHAGAVVFTPGQRRGLGLGGVAGTADAPWYVIAKDLAANTLWVSQDPQHPALRPETVVTAPGQWIGAAPRLPLRCSAQIRYRQQAVTCTVSADGDGLHVDFDQPQTAAAPGQFVVFYTGAQCLGCAEIQRVPVPARAPAA